MSSTIARSLAGLDWVNFFAAAVQTGFGPFIAVFLTLHHWTGLQIGAVLSLGTVTAMASQIPAGIIVDYVANKRLAGGIGLCAIGISALLFVVAPTRFGISVAEILHGFASCMVSPAIAAISLALVSRHALGERLGRNVRFASLGNGVSAGLMGVAGYFLSGGSVFVLTALLVGPALMALWRIEAPPVLAAPDLADPAVHQAALPTWRELRALLMDRRLLAFMLCLAVFQLSDAAMLPYAGRKLAGEAGNLANPLIAAALVLPQLVVAIMSPGVGRAAERRGRRAVLMFGFASEPVRGMLFAFINQPVPLVLIQALDGVGAAVVGVLLPLVAADIARERGHFNLTMGAIGVAVGGGAASSTALAGLIDDYVGTNAALLTLAGAGLVATLVAWLIMPESAAAHLGDAAVSSSSSPGYRHAGP